jgi:hypothetical protein
MNLWYIGPEDFLKKRRQYFFTLIAAKYSRELFLYGLGGGEGGGAVMRLYPP